MAFEWTKLADWLKLKPSILFALALSGAILLFAPSAFLARIGLSEFVRGYLPWIGVVTLLSTAILVSLGLAWLLSNSRSHIAEWWNMRRLRGCFQTLSPPEKAVLRKFLDEQTTTHNFEISDGVVNGLVQKRILWRASNLSAGYTSFPFNLQPWAWEYLQRNPHLLD